MSELVSDCPRCGSKQITFDLISSIPTYFEYGWKRNFEAFSICRRCNQSTVFMLGQREVGDHLEETPPEKLKPSANNFLNVEGYIGTKDHSQASPPEYLPRPVEAAFREAATCMAVGCPNAAATMFRLCIDLSTRPMLPKEDVSGLNSKIRRDLGLRLPWLFANGHLPKELSELSHCVKEDGNDGAHAGTLTKADAEDLLDFTEALLERIFTEPKRLEIAKARRDARRGKN